MSNKLITLMCFVVVLGLAGNAAAQIDPATVTDGHVYFSGGATDGIVPDSSAVGHTANIIGDPQVVDILGGRALQFDGIDDGVHIPDSQWINVTNGPFPNRTVLAIFNCPDVNKPDPQVVFQEGGGTRGFNIYVQANEVIVGGWNKAEYFWDPGSWISAPINSNEWHAVAFVLRDGADAQEDDKFEMWMDGALIGKAPGGQMYNHGNDNSFGYSKNNTVYPDGAGGSATASGEGSYFEGIISEVWILNQALTEAELAPLMVGPQPVGEPLFLDPPDGILVEATSQMLQWRPGELAASHNVYMGTDYDEVAAGTAAAVNTTLGLVTAGIAGGPIPEGLVPDTTYYWRVESVNDLHPESPWSSEVLSIWITPRRAYAPQPADGLINVVDLETDLSWTAGWSPIMHQVYFGTDPDQVANAAGAPLVMDVGYDPGPLAPDTTYYWRVDEFYGTETVKGPVWSFSTVPEVPLADDPNLVAWYTLDEGVGLTAIDWSGHGGHGQLAGDVLWAEGIDGGALAFDGSGGDYVEAPDAPNVTGMHSRTVSAWIKTTNYGEIASWGQDSAGQKWIFRVQESNGTLGAIRVEVNGGYQVGSIDVRDDEWHHTAAVLADDGSPDVMEIALYVDGFLENNSAQLDEPIDTAAGVVRIGQSPWGSRPFNGLIDDVRIYDKAFTEDEMRLAFGDVLIAWQPEPVIGAVGDIWRMAQLSWTPGDGAVEHDVYLGTDQDAVAAADAADTTGIYCGRQAEATYSAGLAWSTTYYWRIDEVAADGTIAAGHIWSFSTTDEIVLYDEVTPFPYDNSADPFLSEVELELDPAQDWTGGCGGGIGAIAIAYDGLTAPGSVTEADGVYTVVGRGDDIWLSSDQFQYAHTTLAGDGSMVVKLESLVFTNNWTKAGIMIRESLDPGSAFAAIFATGANGVRFQARTSSNQDATADDSVSTAEAKALTPPVWLKIERTFPMINAYYSQDGATWTPMAWNPQVIPFTPLPIHIGLAVTSHSGDSTYAEAVFSNISSTGGVAAGPLNSTEIGLESNAAEPMYVVLEDADGATSATLNPVPEATQLVGAEWIVDLDEFTIDRAAVAKVTLVLGDLSNPAPGGSGMITINNVRLLPDCVPVGHWTLDESDGTIASDSSRGGDNDGVLNGTAMSWMPSGGQIGGALAFDGTASNADYVEISTECISTTAGTLAVWGQLAPDPQAPDTRYFFGHTTIPPWGSRIQLYMDSADTNLDMGLGDSHNRHKDIETLATETWYHVALTWDGGNYVVYVNGEEKANGSYTGLDTLNTVADIGNDGRNDETNRTEAFNGLLDDVRIYDVALPPAEIAKLAGL